MRGTVAVPPGLPLWKQLLRSAGPGLLFGIALMAAGQSATFTGTTAGQILMEGFLDLRIPCWQRRLITRALALIPAFIGVAMLGDHAIGKLLVISQVVLGLQLPFAMFPLIRMTGDRTLMGVFVNHRLMSLLAWGLFVFISVANIWLVWQVLAG
nr:divalent metal cation transporter [uncultured Ralstonia sp.]